jgi:hypothetical protein
MFNRPTWPFKPCSLSLASRGLNDVALYKLLYVFPAADRLTLFAGPIVEATDAYPSI